MSATLTSSSAGVAPAIHDRKTTALRYFFNGRIHTMNPAAPQSPHLLLAGHRIWHCSDAVAPLGIDFRNTGFSSTRRQMSQDVEFIDLGGRTLIPGLVDAHVHFLWWALNLRLADLNAARSERDAIERLQSHSGDVAPGEWIVGFGWSHNLWDNPAFPSAAALDAAFPDNPVYLSSKCGHVAWVNSAALAAAQIDQNTSNPQGGEIDRAGGRLTGILKETACSLVHDRIAPPTEEQRQRALREGQQRAHAYGITGMHTPEDLDTWGFMQRAHAAGDLSMRVNFWIPVAALDSLDALQVRHGLGDNQLRISAVKLFSDGSLGGRTALMHAPYEGEAENLGICVCEPEEIRRVTLKANRAGLAMAIHAIGDKAVHNVLQAYSAAQDEMSGNAGPPPVRNRIEHLQVYSEAEEQLLRKVKPIASMQPVHLCADMGPADRFWGQRSRYAYAFRSLESMGCTLAFGSDAPVEPINPFYGLYAAITRSSLAGTPEEGWYAEEKISLHTALQGYTINTAVASGQVQELGSLAPGKLADFVVLPGDPYQVSPCELRDTVPLATYSAGFAVHATDEWLAAI